jgi:hypothetical protein
MDGLALLNEARGAGLTVMAEGSRIIIRGPKRAEVTARRLLEHKLVVLEALRPTIGKSSQMTPLANVRPEGVTDEIEADESINWWERISDQDRQYLLGPHNFPESCPWCGGRSRHNPLCVVPTWEPVLPFGKHKGKRPSETPLVYLRWLLANATSLSSDLRTAIQETLN